MPEMILAVVGVNFRGANARECLARASVGYVARLVRDPNNEHDKNAVQVHVLGMFVGFLPRAHNGPVAAAMDKGTEPTAIIRRPLELKGKSIMKDALLAVSW